MKTIGQQMTHPLNHLQCLLNHSQLLSELQKKLFSMLPSRLSQHCRLANVREHKLVIYVDSSTFAAELRYKMPEFVEKWNENQSDIFPIEKIEIKVHLSNISTISPPPPTWQLSIKAAQTLRDCADGCSYEPLQTVLLRLANHAS